MNNSSQTPLVQRKLYGRRKGRPLRARHRHLMETLLPHVKVTIAEDQIPFDHGRLFGDQLYEEIWLEIGFGAGEHLITQAQRNPHVGILGCEVFLNGVASLLMQMDIQKIKNIRLYTDDARHLIQYLPPRFIHRVFILFPDPWPKQRHHKRRLISNVFISEMARIISPGGELRLASDDQNYVKHMVNIMNENPNFTATPSFLNAPHTSPEDWVETRYEKRGKRKGHLCSYLSYKRIPY
jgi:tRNA (guanine-N7-)-methyltransferase